MAGIGLERGKERVRWRVVSPFIVAYLAHGEAEEGVVEKPKSKRGSEVPSPLICSRPPLASLSLSKPRSRVQNGLMKKNRLNKKQFLILD